MTSACRSRGWPARRDWLKYFSATLSAGFISRYSWADTLAPSLHFPTEARARIAVTSYPFRAYIDSPKNHGRDANLPGMDLKEFPSFVAANFDVFNINPLLDHFNSTDPAYIDAFRVAVERARSHVVDLGLGGRRFYAADSGIRRSAVSFGQQSIDIAVQVGSPSVRQHVVGERGGKPNVSLAAESLGNLAEYGTKRNIVINLENDDPVAEDPFFLVAVIEKVNSPYLRALPDFGNSLIGQSPVYNHKAVEAMLAHAYNMCHVKDTVEDDVGKRSQVDLGSMFALAKASSYRGYFSMEFETRAGDPITGTRRLVEESLQYLS